MSNKLMRATLVALLAVGLVGCAKHERGGGGGEAQRQAANEHAQRTGNDMGDQMRANVTTDLTGEGRDFAEAYARVPWVHANMAAGDWTRALDDLQFVTKKIDGLNADKDVSTALKAKIMTMKPTIVTLTQQIQKHDKAALQTAAILLGRFATLTNEPQMLAWIGEKSHGGGAGR